MPVLPHAHGGMFACVRQQTQELCCSGLTVHGGISAKAEEPLGMRDFAGMGIALAGMFGQVNIRCS